MPEGTLRGRGLFTLRGGEMGDGGGGGGGGG